MKTQIRGNPLALLLVVLLMTACATTRNQTIQTSAQDESTTMARKAEGEHIENLADLIRSQTQDQTSQTQTLLLAAESIPAQTASVTIPIQNLLNLPEGAKYAAQNGRASVEAERHGETLVITGKMDSIARRCLFYESQAFRWRQTSDSLRKLLAFSQNAYSQLDSMSHVRSDTTLSTEIKERPPATWYWWLIIGFVSGVAFAAWLTKTNPIKIIILFIKNLL